MEAINALRDCQLAIRKAQNERLNELYVTYANDSADKVEAQLLLALAAVRQAQFERIERHAWVACADFFDLNSIEG